MRISSIEYIVNKNITLVPFQIALTKNATNDSVIVKITTESGVVGYGEASPLSPITGENIGTVLAVLDLLSPMLIGKSALALEMNHRIMDRAILGNTSAKAAIDIALYDISAKVANLPLYKFLGGDDPVIYSDMTIGIDEPEIMAKLAEKYVGEGFTILKVKVGLDSQNDLRAIKLIRDAVGNEIEIRLDANQGYSKKEALYVLEEMSKYGVEEIEQPLPFHDLDGMRIVTQKSKQIIVADESVKVPEDAHRFVKSDACDMINIKLMKSGGIFKAKAINSIAEAANMRCMVGCMSETKIGISAAAAFAAAHRNIEYVDLDSHRLLEDVKGVSGGFTQDGGKIILSEEPGLGLEIDMDF